MEVYIGMDISLQRTNLCMVDASGKIVHEGSAASDAAELDRYLRTSRGKDVVIKRMVFETGQLSRHLYHSLRKEAWPVVCIDARHAHGTLKAQRVKSDQNDARGLAQIARTGWYHQTHVKSDGAADRLLLLHGRKQIVDMRVNIQNHIRGALKTYGIKLGVVTRKGFRERVDEAITGLDSIANTIMSALLASYDALAYQESVLNAACRKITRSDDVCKRLMTIPGVGAITALAFKAEIDDPKRFIKSRDVGVHVGLTPRRYASGEIDHSGHVSKCGSDLLRSLLFEAANALLTRSKSWNYLKAWGVKLASRSSFKVACTAVARKLSVIMHRMWVDGTEFVYGKETANGANPA